MMNSTFLMKITKKLESCSLNAILRVRFILLYKKRGEPLQWSLKIQIIILGIMIKHLLAV